ncbi:MAG: AsmA-like C-terminal domain-containing protein [Rhodospirillaceae bacterium]|nr:AsmA-like C-terminal domain-containing protein [Rhodospirillaceae bacterium]
MIRKPIRIVVKSLAVTVVLVAIAAGAVAWRLYLGPIETGFAARHVRAELARSFPDLTIAMGKTEAVWPGDMSGLPLRSRDLRLIGKDGGEVAHFPEVVVTILPLALLSGQLRLGSIRFVRPEIALERDDRGSIALRTGTWRSGGQDRFLAMLFGRLAGEPADNEPLGMLRSIEIVDGRVTLSDRPARRVWRADSLRSALRRRPDGLAGDLSLSLGNGRAPARIGGEAVYRKDDGRISGTLTFEGLDPAVLAAVSDSFDALDALRLPLSGKMTFKGSDDGRFHGGALEIAGGAGTVKVPGVYRGPVRIESLHMAAVVEKGARTVDIGRFQADLGDTKLDVSGTVRRTGNGLAVDGNGSLAGFGVKALGRLWPGKIGPNARRWVLRNVGAGRVTKIDARFRLAVREGGNRRVQIHRLAGRFGFEGLKVRLPGSLPALRDVSGEAHFDSEKISFRVQRGRLGNSRISAGSVRIDGLSGKGERIAIDATADGAVQDFLRPIDRKTLTSAKRLGADPATIRGQARVRLKSGFPLGDNLSLAEVPFAVDAQLREVTWPKALFGLDLAKGRFGLTVGKTGIELDGEGTIAGAAAKLGWQEKFGAVSKSWRRQLSIEGVVTPELLRAAGPDLRRMVTGPFGAGVTLSAYDGGRTVVDAAFDFRRARLAIPVLEIAKPAKLSARGAARLVFRGGRLAAIPRFSLQSSPIAFRGKATMEANGRTLRRLTVARFAAGRTQISATLERRGKAGRRLRLTGRALDLSPLLESRPATSARTGATRPPAGPFVEPLDMDFRIDRLFVSRSLPLRSAAGSARYDGRSLRRVRLTAALPSGKSLDFRLTPAGGSQAVMLASDDGGSALRALGIVDNLRGGALSVRALRRPALKGKPMSGTLRLKKFQVERAPAIARFLALAERRRIDGSIRMQRLDMKFDLRGDRLAIREGRAYSSLIGVTAAGAIGRAKRDVRLRGTIVPLYELNSAFSKVPIIGDLLVGEKGSGLLAAHFTVKGSLDKPKFQVNPISLLTPGALRRLFGFGSSGKRRKDERN